MGHKRIRKCPFCGMETNEPRRHWRNFHEEEFPDFQEFIAKFMGIERPVCKWCGGETQWNGSHQQFECVDPVCRSQKAKHAQRTKRERGTCNLSRENRKIDPETGMPVMLIHQLESARLNKLDPERKERLKKEKEDRKQQKIREREEEKRRRYEEWREFHESTSSIRHVNKLVSRFGRETPAVFYCYLLLNLITGEFTCKPGFSTNEDLRRSGYSSIGYRVLKAFKFSGTVEEMAELEHHVLKQTRILYPNTVTVMKDRRGFTNGPTEHRIPDSFDIIFDISRDFAKLKWNKEPEYVVSDELPSLEGVVHCDKFISANKRLDYTRGRKHLSDDYRNEMQQIRRSLGRAQVPKDFMDPESLYWVTLNFGLASGFGRRDADNLGKSVIDAIFGYLGINDNKIVSLEISKFLIKGGFPKDKPQEWLYFKIIKIPFKDNSLTITVDEFKRWAEFNGYKPKTEVAPIEDLS